MTESNTTPAPVVNFLEEFTSPEWRDVIAELMSRATSDGVLIVALPIPGTFDTLEVRIPIGGIQCNLHIDGIPEDREATVHLGSVTHGDGLTLHLHVKL